MPPFSPKHLDPAAQKIFSQIEKSFHEAAPHPQFKTNLLNSIAQKHFPPSALQIEPEEDNSCEASFFDILRTGWAFFSFKNVCIYLLLSVIVFQTGFITTYAYSSENVKPNDMLYPLKRLIENIEYQFIFAPEEKIRKKIYFAHRRQSELEKLNGEQNVALAAMREVHQNYKEAYQMLSSLENIEQKQAIWDEIKTDSVRATKNLKIIARQYHNFKPENSQLNDSSFLKNKPPHKSFIGKKDNLNQEIKQSSPIPAPAQKIPSSTYSKLSNQIISSGGSSSSPQKIEISATPEPPNNHQKISNANTPSAKPSSLSPAPSISGQAGTNAPPLDLPPEVIVYNPQEDSSPPPPAPHDHAQKTENTPGGETGTNPKVPPDISPPATDHNPSSPPPAPSGNGSSATPAPSSTPPLINEIRTFLENDYFSFYLTIKVRIFEESGVNNLQSVSVDLSPLSLPAKNMLTPGDQIDNYNQWFILEKIELPHFVQSNTYPLTLTVVNQYNLTTTHPFLFYLEVFENCPPASTNSPGGLSGSINPPPNNSALGGTGGSQ